MAAQDQTALPPLFRHHIRRPRLTRLLDESRAQIVVLVAPAGYGKTTLAAESLQGRDDVVWYQATPASADVAAFSVALAESIEPVLPRAAERLRQRLSVPDSPARAARSLAELLVEDIIDWPENGWLVIDDYHFLAGSTAIESFLDSFLDRIGSQVRHLRVLVTARSRPSWLTARRRMYGQVGEITREDLSMTPSEAAQMLGDQRASLDLVRLANGWPALLGLAALTTSAERVVQEVPSTLFPFFAEEVLSQQRPELREWLLRASVVPVLDTAVARQGLCAASDLLDEAIELGLLERFGSQRFRLHPLLREFLRSRARHEIPDLHLTIARALDNLIARRLWEEAFLLAIEDGTSEQALKIVSLGKDDLLKSGQLELLESWLKACGNAAVVDEDTSVTYSELLLRKGEYAASLAISETLLARPTTSRGGRFSAYCLVGRAYHFSSRDNKALTAYSKARSLALDTHERRAASWGAFLAAVAQELDSASTYLADLQTHQDDSIEARMQMSVARAYLAGLGHESYTTAWREMRPLISLVPVAGDLYARSRFLAQAAYVRLATAYYRDAKNLADQTLALCRSYGLEIGLVFGLIVRALAEVALRQAEAARRTLHEILATPSALEDPYVRGMVEIVRTKLLLTSRSRPPHTLSEDCASAPAATRGELAALRALVYIQRGDTQHARALLRGGETITRGIEARMYARFARAALAYPDRPTASELVLGAFDEAQEMGFLDAFVFGYRARPELLQLLADDPQRARQAITILERAQDLRLARKYRLTREPLWSLADPQLTPREIEVLRLIRDGYNNAEIAARLVISPFTAKVHVRHILEKLGVRSRFDAARAADAVLPED